MEIEKDWNKKDSSELIMLFQDENQTKFIRDSAFYTLIVRFRKDILNKCEIICKNYGHSITVAEQIAESTFKSYATKGCFKLEKVTNENIDKSFKLYLYGIARRELTNFYRFEERKRKGFDSDGSETIVIELPDFSNRKLSLESKIKIKAIQSLPISHQTVYLTYTKYEKLGCNLPRKLQKELREHLGVKQNTIRTYKKEAIDKIAEFLKIMKLTQREA